MHNSSHNIIQTIIQCTLFPFKKNQYCVKGVHLCTLIFSDVQWSFFLTEMKSIAKSCVIVICLTKTRTHDFCSLAIPASQ